MTKGARPECTKTVALWWRRNTWAAALLFCATAISTPAQGQSPAPPPIPTDLGEANDDLLSTDRTVDSRYRALVKDALQEWQLGLWPEARARFIEAHKLLPSARTLRGIGLCEFEARLYLDAVVHLEAALGDARRPLTVSQHEDVKRTLDRARGYVATFELNLPPGAQLWVDGQPAVVRDRNLLLGAGVHELVATLERHETEKRHVNALPGQRGRLNFQLAPTGTDEQRPASPPSLLQDPAVQPHGLSSTQLWTWVGAGTTVALGATALGAHVAATGAADSVREECDRSPCTQEELGRLEDVSNLRRWETVRTVGLASAAVALAATGVLLALEIGAGDGEQRAAVSPFWTASSAGVTGRVAF